MKNMEVESSLAKEAELMRARVREQRNSLPSMHDEVGALEAKANAIPDMRHLQRQRHHLRQQAAQMRARIAQIESGEAEAEVERRTDAYMRAERSLRTAQRHETSRLGVVQLESGQHSTLLHEYKAEMGVEAPTMTVSEKDQCPMCHGALILVQLKALLTCRACGYSTPHVDSTSNNLAYNEEMSFQSSFHYKRISHFEDWMRQMQAKETTIIGDDVLRDVMGVLNGRNLTPERVTHKNVREALKTLKYRKCYDFTTQIHSKLTGIPAPRLTVDLEEKCRVMFIASEYLYVAHYPDALSPRAHHMPPQCNHISRSTRPVAPIF